MTRRLPVGLLLLIALAPVLALSVRGPETWPARDTWQRPDDVLNELRVKTGSVVADVGAGDGYFTQRLARRVGPTGKVYAEDTVSAQLAKIRVMADRDKLPQIEAVLGTTSSPQLLSATLDAILVVDAYHEFVEHDAMMTAMLRALKPAGRLAIIDASAEPRADDKQFIEVLHAASLREMWALQHRIAKQDLLDDAKRMGFRLVNDLPGFVDPDALPARRNYFFVVFDRPPASGTASGSR